MSQQEALEFELWVQYAQKLNVNTDPQSLLSSSQCYVCQGVSLFEALKISLLARISQNHNPANPVDAPTLLSQSKCYACFSNATIAELMELALLAQIAS